MCAMTIRNLTTILTTAALATWILDVIFLLILAAPLSWLWNHAVAPILGSMPTIGYTRTVGLLLFWSLLKRAHTGLHLSAELKDSE
jgi:hypothetical protein